MKINIERKLILNIITKLNVLNAFNVQRKKEEDILGIYKS